jgi:uncharacterized protein
MPQPTPREALPDRLRGIALLGIVVVNVAFLGISADGPTQESAQGFGNTLATASVFIFAQGKFYLLFSFLFGYSASFILRDQTPANRRRYLRRMIGLFLFGLAHAVFFFVGDILITYSILGLLLFFVSRSSDDVLRALIIASVAVSVFLVLALSTLTAAFPTEGSALPDLQSALANGTFLEASIARLEALPAVLFSVLLLQGPMAFAAFLLGLQASRRRLLADPQANVELWRRLAIWGWGIGLPLQIIAGLLQTQAVVDGNPYSPGGAAGLALGITTAPILTAGYVGSIALLLARRSQALGFLAPAGRMSLTVYIGESVILSLVFCAYGLGYFGDWGALAVVAIAIASWVVLSIFAWLWMKRFARGPLENALAVITGPRR